MRAQERREQALVELQARRFDLCVIGGGATGSGCALDAQTRGLNTVLLEGNDFASATSSASTKLVHGGVRYLQKAIAELDMGQYHVVRRALKERARMIANAPYLARPIEIAIPCHRWIDLIYYMTGLKIYDLLAGKHKLFPCQVLSARRLIEALPAVDTKQLIGGMAFADGQFDDARYNLALIETFVEAGGTALNYAKVVSFEKSFEKKLVAAICQDQLTGRRFQIEARCFINATGPHADELRTAASSNAPSRLEVSRGTHIVLPQRFFPSDTALLVPKTQDDRIIFIIPWSNHVLVGTTDDESALQDDLLPKASEIDYLLHYFNRYVTTSATRADVLSAFVGLRPLVKKKAKTSSKDIIRDHEIEIDEQSGLISVLGGKWTTYRAMAEHAVNAVQASLHLPRSSCLTYNLKLAGAEEPTSDYWQTLMARFRVSELTSKHLVDKFGARAEKVLELGNLDTSLLQPLLDDYPFLHAEVVYAIRHEMALSIDDVLARRIGVEFVDLRAASRAAATVAKRLGCELDWPEGEEYRAVETYREKIETRLRCVDSALQVAGQ